MGCRGGEGGGHRGAAAVSRDRRRHAEGARRPSQQHHPRILWVVPWRNTSLLFEAPRLSCGPFRRAAFVARSRNWVSHPATRSPAPLPWGTPARAVPHLLARLQRSKPFHEGEYDAHEEIDAREEIRTREEISALYGDDWPANDLAGGDWRHGCGSVDRSAPVVSTDRYRSRQRASGERGGGASRGEGRGVRGGGSPGRGARGERDGHGPARGLGERARTDGGSSDDLGMPRTGRRNIPAEGHGRCGCAEIAELEVGLSEEGPGVDRDCRRAEEAEAAGSCRTARQRHGHARGPRDAGAFAAARQDVLHLTTVSRKGVLPAAMVLGAIALGARQASACDCVGMPTREYFRSADRVYAGRVTGIRVGPRFAWPEIEFQVQETLKGRIPSRSFVLQTPNGKGVDCEGFDFTVGGSYLVFASARNSVTGHPNTYGVSWCAGTALLDSDEGKQRLQQARVMASR